MQLAADYPFMSVLWTMFVFFALVMVLGFVIMCLIDNFRRPDLSGGAKAAWTLLIIILPLIGALAYQITRPKEVPYDSRSGGSVPAMDAPNTPTSARDEATHIRTGL